MFPGCCIARPYLKNSIGTILNSHFGNFADPDHRTTMKTISLFLALCIALFASGCGGMFKGKKAAEQSVADFHKLYNDGKLTEIYSAGHSKFKSATTEKQFLEFLGAVQRKLGKVTQTTEAGFNIRSFNLTTTIVLSQNT